MLVMKFKGAVLQNQETLAEIKTGRRKYSNHVATS